MKKVIIFIRSVFKYLLTASFSDQTNLKISRTNFSRLRLKKNIFQRKLIDRKMGQYHNSLLFWTVV